VLSRVLSKAHLGGIVKAIKVSSKGAFEVVDENKLLMISYAGTDKDLFKDEIGIIDLGTFVSILNATENPTMKYNSKDGVLSIDDGKKKFKYLTADPSVVTAAEYKASSDEHVTKVIKKVPAASVNIAANIPDLLKACSILKDATQIIISKSGKKAIIEIGGEYQNSYEATLDVELPFDEKILLSKKEMQAVLTMCEGDTIMELRSGENIPVVIREKDLTVYINKM
jgi:hypothetical protein